LKFRLERLDRHARLLCADVLHVEAENAGELGEVIDVAARLDHLQYAAALHCRFLLVVEAEFPAISLFVGNKGGTIFGAVEREAHAVERQALLRLVSVEDGGACDVLLHPRSSPANCWSKR
jgi:hypothetical protein